MRKYIEDVLEILNENTLTRNTSVLQGSERYTIIGRNNVIIKIYLSASFVVEP